MRAPPVPSTLLWCAAALGLALVLLRRRADVWHDPTQAVTRLTPNDARWGFGGGSSSSAGPVHDVGLE